MYGIAEKIYDPPTANHRKNFRNEIKKLVHDEAISFDQVLLFT